MTMLQHVTITSGHVRASPRSEVGDDIIPVVRALLAQSKLSPAVIPGGHYRLTSHESDACLVARVWDGDFDIATMWVCDADGPHASRVWQQAGGGGEVPAAPWCAVVLRPDIASALDAAHWLGDFERCLAWAWIERTR